MFSKSGLVAGSGPVVMVSLLGEEKRKSPGFGRLEGEGADTLERNPFEYRAHSISTTMKRANIVTVALERRR